MYQNIDDGESPGPDDDMIISTGWCMFFFFLVTLFYRILSSM